jgi:hypothetical protein
MKSKLMGPIVENSQEAEKAANPFDNIFVTNNLEENKSSGTKIIKLQISQPFNNNNTDSEKSSPVAVSPLGKLLIPPQ